MSGETLGSVVASYFGGPLDGLEVDVPPSGHRWARYTDPRTGVQHFYELVWRDDCYAYVYRPEPKR
jgi:hypothetical protein